MRSRVCSLVLLSFVALLLVSIAGAAGPLMTTFKVESLPTSIAAGPDGNLWFIDDNSNGYGKITPAGVVSTWNWHSLGRAHRPLSQIAGGPGRHILFTLLNCHAG